jgi:hypothetical protein
MLVQECAAADTKGLASRRKRLDAMEEIAFMAGDQAPLVEIRLDVSHDSFLKTRQKKWLLGKRRKAGFE